MKKVSLRVLAITLITIVLMPLGAFSAEEHVIEKGQKGFHNAWAWYKPNKSAEGNIFQTFYIAAHKNASRPDDKENAMCNLYSETPLEAAQKMKRFMENKPEGHRVIQPIMSRLIYDPNLDDTRTFDNWFWWDEGIQKNIDVLKELLFYYKKIGGPDIDGMILDYECGCDVFNMEWCYVGGSTLLTAEEMEVRFQGIIDDSRYLTDVRPGLEAIGFEFYQGSDHNELYNYWYNPGKVNTPAMKNFYLGIQYASQRKDMYLNKIYEFVRDNFYPDIICANYGSSPRLYNSDNPYNYHMYCMFETPAENKEDRPSTYFGNMNAPLFYGQMLASETKQPYSSYPYETFKLTPFNDAFWTLLCYEEMMSFKDGANYKGMPWIGSYAWDYTSPFAATDYWSELVLHGGLHNINTFQTFNNQRLEWLDEDKILSDLLYELDELVGFEDKTCLWEKIMDCDQRYLLSGTYAGGKNAWRITPDLYTPDESVPGGFVTVDSFCIDKENPTFKIGNQYVRFPEGSFIYKPEREVSEIGYWVISPEGTRPEQYRDESEPIPPQAVYTYVKDAETAKLKEKITGIETQNITQALPFTKSYREEVVDDTSYSDVVGHWAEKELCTLISKGVIHGDGVNIFPDKMVSKAEFLAMLLRGLGIPENELKNIYKDVPADSWFANVIQTSVDHGYITDTNGYILPNTKLKREDMAVILYNMLPNLKSKDEATYTDELDISENSREAVKKIFESGLITGYPDHTFKPQAVCTRAQAAIIIDRILALDESERSFEDN